MKYLFLPIFWIIRGTYLLFSETVFFLFNIIFVSLHFTWNVDISSTKQIWESQESFIERYTNCENYGEKFFYYKSYIDFILNKKSYFDDE